MTRESQVTRAPPAGRGFSDAVAMAINVVMNADAFTSAMLLTVALIECDTPELKKKIPTAGTDCFKKIWLNPDFFATMTAEHGAAVIAHEVGHIVRMHGIRMSVEAAHNGGIYPVLYNIAGDFVINADLCEYGYDMDGMAAEHGAVTIQQVIDGMSHLTSSNKGFMYDTSVTPEDTVESVYARLIENLPPQPEGGGKSNSILGGTDMDGDEFDKTCIEEGVSSEEAARVIAEDIKQAVEAVQASGRGSVPGYVDGVIDAVSPPKKDWRAALRRFVSAIARDDFSYRRANRRSTAPVILPSLYSERVGKGYVLIDDSGSVSDEELGAALSELSAVSKRVKPEGITVLTCDTRVTKTERYKSGEEITHILTGGRGGTDMTPGFAEINRLAGEEGKPAFVLCFTDGEMSWPDSGLVKWPLLWVICNERFDDITPAPYGRWLHLDL